MDIYPRIIINIIIYFENVHFFHAKLGLAHIRSLHISLNTAHSGCKPSDFISSSTHSYQIFLFLPLHLAPASTELVINFKIMVSLDYFAYILNYWLCPIPAHKLPKDDSEFYQFCYVGSSGQIHGASTPFQFKTMSADDLIEIEDENGELLVIRTKTADLEEQLKKASDVKMQMKQVRVQKLSELFVYRSFDSFCVQVYGLGNFHL